MNSRLFFLAAFAVLASSFGAIAQDDMLVVEGYVYDLNAKPVDGAIVAVFPVGAQGGLVKTTTKDGGYYRLTVKRGTVFDIGYGHPSVGLITLNRLTCDKNHFISKVICRDPANDAAKSLTMVFEHIQGIENIAYKLKFHDPDRQFAGWLQEYKLYPRTEPFELALAKVKLNDAPEARYLAEKLRAIKELTD